MNTVTVSKSELLKTLQENRTQHREIFEEAQVKYREAAIEELDRMLEDARQGRKIRRAVSMPEPQDFTDTFDTAIKMLEWEVEEEVQLTREEFAQFVENKWAWREAFNRTSNSYVNRDF